MEVETMKRSKVLVISTELDSHLELVIKELNRKNISCVNFFPEELPCFNSLTYHFCAKNNRFKFFGSLKNKNESIDLESILSVWFRKPKPHIISNDLIEKGIIDFSRKETENSLEWLYKILECRWVNNPIQSRYVGQKSYQLKMASKLNLKIPRSLVTNDPDDVIDFFKKCNGQVAIKPFSPPAVASNDGVCGLYTHKLKKEDLSNIDFVKYAPCFFQEYIKKKSELRLTVVGNKIFSCEIDSQANEESKYDWRRSSKIFSVPHKIINLPFSLEKKYIRLIKEMGLLFGAIDVIKTPEDKYVFLEVNPNGQWLWIEQLTGAKISKAIADLLSNA